MSYITMNDLTEHHIYIILLNYIHEKEKKKIKNTKTITYFYILLYKND